MIAGFNYLPGDFTANGRQRCIPTIKKGQSISFVNDDASPSASLDIFSPSPLYRTSIFHSITTCKYPCGLNTGISYPLANGSGNFDSGQLGAALPAVGRVNWSDADQSAARDLHVLLPDPPVHAGRVPGHRLVVLDGYGGLRVGCCVWVRARPRPSACG